MATTTTTSKSSTTATPAAPAAAEPVTSAQTPQGFSLAGFLDLAAPVSDSQPFDDGGHYLWVLRATQVFECVKTPAGKEMKIGTKVDQVTAPDTWDFLMTKYHERAPAPAPTPTPSPAPGPAPAPAPSEAAPAAPAEPAPTPAPEPTDGGALDQNLVEAQKLVDTVNKPHTYSVDPIAGDPTGADRRDALLDGDTGQLKSIVCSEFTVLTLQKSGVDLTQRYLERSVDPPMPIAYSDKNGLTFVDLYMVTNNQPEAAASLLAAQHGNAERVEPGSDRAKELGTNEPAAFLHFSAFETAFIKGDTRIAFDPEAGDHFGAGATAISLGGCAVEANDRRPGDIQQRWDTNSGQTAGQGHSSTVYSVRARGVAFFGGPNSPTLVPAPTCEIPAGWYRAEEIFWELTPTTDPAMVGELDVDYVQLIEANLSSTDATRIGKMGAEDEVFDAKAASSSITSSGRLPTSKWFDKPPVEAKVIGTITKNGIQPA